MHLSTPRRVASCRGSAAVHVVADAGNETKKKYPKTTSSCNRNTHHIGAGVQNIDDKSPFVCERNEYPS